MNEKFSLASFKDNFSPVVSIKTKIENHRIKNLCKDIDDEDEEIIFDKFDYIREKINEKFRDLQC